MIKKLAVEKRIAKRNLIAVPVICTCADIYRVFNGTSFDISNTGMSFFIDTPLREGLNVQINSKHFWDQPRDAMIRWCNAKSYNCYKVGVSFL
jgi:hypothetical protein